MSKFSRLKRITTWTTVTAVTVSGIGAGYIFGAFESLGERLGIGTSTAEANAEVRAVADTYTMTGRPDENTGDQAELFIGGSDAGVAVSYLRFDLGQTPSPEAMTLRLPVSQLDTAELIEVTAVGSSWDEYGLTANQAPPFGAVLGSKQATPGEQVVEIPLPRAATSTVSFAVTTPGAKEPIRFHSRESAVAVPSLRSDAAASPGPPAAEAAAVAETGCVSGPKLVPNCGALLGVAPGAHSDGSKTDALHDFEAKTGRAQHIYHSYHRGTSGVFPTEAEIAVANDPQQPRALFINWKPREASWAEIAAGDAEIDAYLDKLAGHIAQNHDREFFFTVHHEPEDDVRPKADSGYTATDYAAMFRHVVERLRAGGATDIVSVMVYMAYLPWTEQEWHSQLYPGDDVVDWVGWDTYGYSDPGYGHGDFAELVNRVGNPNPAWPGFYRWAAEHFPAKPLMIAEWGVWYSKTNPDHQAKVFDSAAVQMALFPRLKAMVYFESASAEGRDSRVDIEDDALDAYRRFAESMTFRVSLQPS